MIKKNCVHKKYWIFQYQYDFIIFYHLDTILAQPAHFYVAKNAHIYSIHVQLVELLCVVNFFIIILYFTKLLFYKCVYDFNFL